MRVERSTASALSGLRFIRSIDREPAGDLGTGGALQPVIDLMLQQFGRLVEQIDPDQPVAEAATISSPRRPIGVSSRKS